MAVENLSGLIKVLMKETSFKIISMVKASTDGLTVVYITVSGSIRKSKAKELSHGAMDVDT